MTTYLCSHPGLEFSCVKARRNDGLLLLSESYLTPGITFVHLGYIEKSKTIICVCYSALTTFL